MPPMLRVEELTMMPIHPRAGETVIFRIRIRNAGAQPVEDAVMDFSLVGSAVRQREQISLGPRESQQFEFEWQANGSGRLVPRVVIDPERRVQGLDRADTLRSLEPFEIAGEAAAGAPALPGPRPETSGFGALGTGVMERSQVRLVAGGCVGFRFASGTAQACAGGSDIELRASEDGTTVTIQAEGVRSLGARPLDQVAASADLGLSQTALALPGFSYVIETRRGAAALRIVQIRRSGVASPVPPALRRPAVAGRPRVRGLEREEEPEATGAQILLQFEWRILPL